MSLLDRIKSALCWFLVLAFLYLLCTSKPDESREPTTRGELQNF